MSLHDSLYSRDEEYKKIVDRLIDNFNEMRKRVEVLYLCTEGKIFKDDVRESLIDFQDKLALVFLILVKFKEMGERL